MYKKAIKENSKYLIPFIEGIKYYGSNEIEHGLGTMMILNKNGDILTCKHIAKEFIENETLSKKYKEFLKEYKDASKEERSNIEKKYNYKKDSIVLSNINLPFNIEGQLSIEIKFHKYLDIAVIRFKGVNFECDKYPIFSKKLPLQGQSLCKLGFAFPEYSYFEYSKKANNIILKKEITSNFPLFPMDGIMTRHVVDENGNISMFETSTPGLRGQSGGPVFSPEGIVYGMQSMTRHLDLNFDVNADVKRGINKKKVNFTPFINLGIEINSVKIIEFLEENNIEYNSL